MVEFALVLVLLVMLLVGTVSAAIAYGRSNSIQNAAREASRFGATLDDLETKLAQVIGVAQAASTGDLDPSAPGYYICAAYYDGSAWHRETDGSGASPPPDFCFDDMRPADESRVQVVVQRDSDFQVIVFSTDITLSAEAAARYER